MTVMGDLVHYGAASWPQYAFDILMRLERLHMQLVVAKSTLDPVSAHKS
jgi:hypothetical protein